MENSTSLVQEYQAGNTDHADIYQHAMGEVYILDITVITGADTQCVNHDTEIIKAGYYEKR